MMMERNHYYSTFEVYRSGRTYSYRVTYRVTHEISTTGLEEYPTVHLLAVDKDLTVDEELDRIDFEDARHFLTYMATAIRSPGSAPDWLYDVADDPLVGGLVFDNLTILGTPIVYTKPKLGKPRGGIILTPDSVDRERRFCIIPNVGTGASDTMFNSIECTVHPLDGYAYCDTHPVPGGSYPVRLTNKNGKDGSNLEEWAMKLFRKQVLEGTQMGVSHLMRVYRLGVALEGYSLQASAK